MKKGVVDVPLAVGMLICVALVFILGVFVFQAIVSSSITGSNKMAAKNIALLADTAYAAPEDVETVYDVEIDPAGWPTIGTLALDGDEGEVCISKYTEDEMWEYILNAAVTGWVTGVLAKVYVKHKFSRPIIMGMATTELTGSPKIGAMVVASIFTKKAAKLIFVATKKGIRTIYKRIATRSGASVARFSVAQGSIVAANSANVLAGLGEVIKRAIAVGAQIVDYVLTVMPMLRAIDSGYEASQEMGQSLSCQSFNKGANAIIADPPNCRVTTDPEYLLVETADCDEDEAGNYGQTVSSQGIKCLDCPNYFISAESKWIDDFGEYTAESLQFGAKTTCYALSLASPMAGMVCNIGYYSFLIANYKLNAGRFMALFTGANILPKEEWYTMTLPVRVGISKDYNQTTGESYLMFEKNKADLIISKEYVSDE